MVYDGLPALDLWTIETVEEVVRTREFEPSRFDYKEVLVPERGDEKRREEHRLSIRKTVCAMANGQGGLILFGVADRKADVASPEARIVGISLDHDLVKEFGDQTQHIEPELHFQVGTAPIRLRDDATRGVFIVSIEESSLRPHMVMPEHIYYRRGDGGQNVKMKHDEVRDQMLYGEERLRQMTLLRLELRQILDTCMTLLYRYNGRPFASRRRFEVSGIKPLLANVCSMIPSDEMLHSLMHIVNMAVFMNAYLDEAVRIGYTWQQAAGAEVLEGDMDNANHTLMTNMPELESRCRICIETLDGLFGPMTQLPPFPPSPE